MFERERALLHKILAPWPRRGHSLLEVNCGTGRFLELFWEAGFDVTGLDRNLPLLELARHRLEGRADLQVGVPHELPYDDNAFDYVALMTPLANTGPAPHDILREAARVAAKGILLRFWNPFSLAGLFCRLLPRFRAPAPPPCACGLTWRDYCALLRTLSPGCTLFTRSCLLGPPCSWRAGFTGERLNGLMLPLPLGGVGMLRMEQRAAPPLTSLPLRLKNLRVGGARAATVMERAQSRQPQETDVLPRSFS